MGFDDDEDRGDLTRFFVDHKRELLALARYLTGNHHDAQELLGVTAEKLARSWHKSRNKDIGYARTVMKNAWRDMLRSKRRRPREVALEGRLDEEDTSNRLDHAAEVRARITTVMASLTKREIAIFSMHAYQGLGFKEIALELYVSESTARKTWQRIEARLTADG